MNDPALFFEPLRARLKGELRADPYSRSLYATDASIYEIEPLAVASPRDEADVVACVKFCAEHNVSVIVRGAGTGLAGEALGRALILDCSVHFKTIAYDKANQSVTVGPGVVLDELNRALKPHGVYFPVDPSSASRCTLGGMIANNASGARSLRFGDTRKNILAVRVVLSDGSVTEARAFEVGGAELENRISEQGRAGEIYRAVPELLSRHVALITERMPPRERNSCGYALDHAFSNGIFDFAKLLCGSQGTLGIITQATLRVWPLPTAIGMCVMHFESLADATAVIPAIREHRPMCCELMDETLMKLGRGARPELAHLLPPNARAMLILEFDGENDADVARKMEALRERIQAARLLALTLVSDREEQKKIWALRNAATPLLFQRNDRLQPTPFVEDGAVRPEKLGDYLARAEAIFAKHGIEWSAYAHAGAGEVHIRPMLDLRKPEHAALLEPIAEAMHEAVWACGGVISGEHGDGLARTQWLERQYGSELYGLFKTLKTICDPAGILNPDKKITNDPHLMTRNLRLGSTYDFGARKEATALVWPADSFAAETERCNGCGHCRTPGPEEAMCPRFKFHGVEAASPRAKANAVRRMMSLRQSGGSFSDRDIEEIAEYCFNCKLCVDGCPSRVNIPKLVMELKARYFKTHALPREVHFFGRIETLLRLGQYAPRITNAFLKSDLTRAALQRLFGVDARRPLPPLKPFSVKTRRAGGRQVVLFTDLYARYHAPEVAQAAVDVLELYGFDVILADAPWTNMPALESGALELARSSVRAVTASLAPFARDGLPIICTEPSACLALRDEFLNVLDTPDVRAVSRMAREIGAFLREAPRPSRPLQPLPARVAYHQGCHHKALNVATPLWDELRRIPELQVECVSRACCGMAGTFGMTARHFDESMAIGKPVFEALLREKNQIAATACESSACGMQLSFGSGLPNHHPIQWLAAAYGFEAGIENGYPPKTSQSNEMSAPEKREKSGHGYH